MKGNEEREEGVRCAGCREVKLGGRIGGEERGRGERS